MRRARCRADLPRRLASPERQGREGGSAGGAKAGFSLLEAVIALGVIAIALLGVTGLLLALHQHNTSTSETSVAFKACQEMMEQLRTMTYDQVKAQDGVTFVARKLHPTQPVGLVTIVDISPPGDPDTVVQIVVSIVTQPGVYTRQAINVQLVSWKTSK